MKYSSNDTLLILNSKWGTNTSHGLIREGLWCRHWYFFSLFVAWNLLSLYILLNSKWGTNISHDLIREGLWCRHWYFFSLCVAWNLLSLYILYTLHEHFVFGSDMKLIHLVLLYHSVNNYKRVWTKCWITPVVAGSEDKG